MSERKAYPLSWPEGWKRTTSRTSANFGKTNAIEGGRSALKRLSVADAVLRVLGELKRMGIGDWNVIISTNVPLRLDGFPRSDSEPSDPGAAVYWKVSDKKPMRCMAIDRYRRVADNLAAIAATLEAMRAIERHGGATILDRAFLGFAALPETASQPWREVLGIDPSQAATLDLVESRYRALAKVHHPDVKGKEEDFLRITQARDAARLELAS